MKGIKFLLSVCVFALGLNLNAQSPFPVLKDNQSAKELIQWDIDNLEIILKNNPSPELNRKLDLYEMAMSFLNEPSQIPTTTEYSLTSAFLNHEVKWNNLNDSEAFMKWRIKQWSKEFQDLINLVKN